MQDTEEQCKLFKQLFKTVLESAVIRTNIELTTKDITSYSRTYQDFIDTFYYYKLTLPRQMKIIDTLESDIFKNNQFGGVKYFPFSKDSFATPIEKATGDLPFVCLTNAHSQYAVKERHISTLIDCQVLKVFNLEKFKLSAIINICVS